MNSNAVVHVFSIDSRRYLPGIFVFVCLVACLLTGACRESVPAKEQVRTDTDDRIEFYRNKIAGSDKHYPSYALLADALLRKAKETGDPAFLAEARSNVETSMGIQPNYTAMKTMAMISNYSHRFADALAWAEKTAEASAEGLENDAELTGIFVEAHLGLGEVDKADADLQRYESAGHKDDNFYVAAARAGVLKAKGQVDEAVRAFELAEQFAVKQNVPELIVWCNAMEAGCYIDVGRLDESKPYLDKGKSLLPANKLILIHEAEYLAGVERQQEALDIYENLLKAADDPEIHRRAYVLASDLGLSAVADAHWKAAELGFVKILDSGEIYTLGPLAQLYCDRGEDLEKAKMYAVRNLEYKRDPEAQKTYKCVMDKLSGDGK